MRCGWASCAAGLSFLAVMLPDVGAANPAEFSERRLQPATGRELASISITDPSQGDEVVGISGGGGLRLFTERLRLAQSTKGASPIKRPVAGNSKEVGAVVGRMLLKLDGYKGLNQTFAREDHTVHISRIHEGDTGEQVETTHTVKSDKDGYFLLSNIGLTGAFQVQKLAQQAGVEIPSPAYASAKEFAKSNAALFFAGWKRWDTPFVDLGEVTLVVHKDATVGIEQVNAPNHWSIRGNQLSRKSERIAITPVLDHFAKNGPAGLRPEVERFRQRYKQYLLSLAESDKADQVSKQEGKAPEAVTLYRAALAKSPDNCAAHHGLVELLGKSKQRLEEVGALRAGAQRCNWDDNFPIRLAQRYEADKDIEGARAILVEALPRFPRTFRIINALSDILYRSGQVAQALAVWNDQWPHLEGVDKYLHLGRFLAKNSDFEKALSYLRSYDEQTKGSHRAKQELIELYIRQGAPDKAEDILKKQQRASLYYAAHLNARIARRYDLALSFLDRAVELKGDGSLTMDAAVLRSARSSIEHTKQLDDHWIRYLKEIQDEQDYGNWSKAPLEAYQVLRKQ